MTDADTTDGDSALGDAYPEMPEMDSYTITAARTFEVDFSQRQLEQFMEQVGTDDPEEAVEQVFVQREVNNVAPEQKLLGAQVDAEAPNDDTE